jgi:hypothetical protein
MGVPAFRRCEMRMDEEWPDRVYVEASQYDRMHELYSKTSEDARDVPFRSLKEILMASALLGYNLGVNEELESKKEIIFTKYLDSQIDIPLVVCLAIAKQGNTDVVDDKQMIIEIFQGYIKGGFDSLYEAIKEGSDGVQSYAHYLLKNYVKEG